MIIGANQAIINHQFLIICRMIFRLQKELEMKKQPEITDKTRQAFIEVFCELYSQKPIEKISIQEIANK